VDLTDMIGAVSGTEFEEEPVTLEEFVTSKRYLGLPPLSNNQMLMVRAMTQIYKQDTLVKLYGHREGMKRWYETCNEVVLQLGKGTISDSSLVWTHEYGYRKPTELLDSYGTLLRSHHGLRSSSAFYSEGIDDTFLVTTKKGHRIECNLSHGLFGWKSSKNGKTYSMRSGIQKFQLAELAPGDILAINYGYEQPENPVVLTDDEALFIGYMLGDGTFGRVGGRGHGMRNPCFTNATPEVQKDFIRIIENLGGTTREYTSGYGCWAVRVNGLNDIVRALGLTQKYGEKKQWAGWWLNTTDRALALILEGFFATDGWSHVQSRGSGTSVQIGWETNSESLMTGVHYALTRLGIVSKFKKHRTRTNRNHSDTYRTMILGFADAIRFARIVSPRGKSLDNIIEAAAELGIVEREETFIYGDRIESVYPIGKKELYTTMVEIDHSYTANGMIHANSGKDYCSTIACAYIVYLLLCLKDPAEYYGKPPGDAIDIINIAINANQAKNVFFKGFTQRITKSPWFAGKYNPKSEAIEFDKEITVHSGHSEREAWEGYNVIVVILDEISGFALDSTSGHTQAKTASEIYLMYKASVASRFPDYGKLLLLSFPRFKSDFIQQRYDEVVAAKEVIQRSERIVFNPEFPHDDPTNHAYVNWDEDHIISYRQPKIFALKRPTWDVNPTKTLENFIPNFLGDHVDSLSRFACMPPDSIDGFFKDRAKVEFAFSNPRIAIDEWGNYADWFKPDKKKQYYIHVDLAQKIDRCVVSMSHVERWVEVKIGRDYRSVEPYVVTDFVRYWTPTSDKTVDFAEVRQFIVDIVKRGFDVRLVTFDRWNSLEMSEYLETFGIHTDTLSVAKQHYQDMLFVIMEERLSGPQIELIVEELLGLRVIKDKIDHPRSGSKDLADSVCGSIFNAIAHTPKNDNKIVEIHTIATGSRPDPEDKEAEREKIKSSEPMPEQLRFSLDNMTVI